MVCLIALRSVLILCFLHYSVANRIRVLGCPSLFDVDLVNPPNFTDIPKCYCDNATETSNVLVQVNCLYSTELSDLTASLQTVIRAKKVVHSIYLQDANFGDSIVPDEYFSNLDVAPKEIVFVNCLNGDALTFADNAFKGLDKSLTSIKIDGCKLTSFPKAIAKLKQLEALVLKKTSFAELTKADLAQLTNLKMLEVSGNELHLEQGVFGKLRQLDTLKLSTNTGLNSTVFPEVNTLTSLTALDLSGNNIKDLKDKPFAKLTGLRRLNLNFNYIANISASSFRSLTELRMLDLRVNLISSIENGAFDELENLDELLLAGNYISEIRPKVFALNNLTKLDLGYNELAELKNDSMKGLKTLRKLNLDKNERLHTIQTGAFNGLDNLRSLNLSYANFTSFDGDIFKPLDNLAVLDLSNTAISNLTRQELVHLANLSFLIISNTQMETFNDTAFNQLKRLKRLDASENKWNCDKRLKNMVRFLQNKESNVGIAAKFRSSKLAKCWLPIELRDLPLVALNLEKTTA